MVTLLAAVDIAGVDSEEIAAELLNDGHYIVRSVPVMAEGIALGDIVACVVVDGRLHIDRVIIAGGNTTLRVLVESPLIDQLLSQLESLGCRVEQPLPGLLAINLPPDSPGEGVRAYLEGLASDGHVQIAPGDITAI